MASLQKASREIFPVLSNRSMVGDGIPVISDNVLLLYPLSSLRNLQLPASLAIKISG